MFIKYRISWSYNDFDLRIHLHCHNRPSGAQRDKINCFDNIAKIVWWWLPQFGFQFWSCLSQIGIFSPRQVSPLQLSACLTSEKNKGLTLINIVASQQLILSCRESSSKKVNWKRSVCNSFNNCILLQDSKSKAKVSEEVQEEVKVEENVPKEVILFKLSEEDVEFIYDNTHYTMKDIKDWHR